MKANIDYVETLIKDFKMHFIDNELLFTYLDIFIITIAMILMVIMIYHLINDLLRPFVWTTKKPDNKCCNIIRYEKMPCLYCDNYVEGFYKRTILGFVGWTGANHCDKCSLVQ